jgi:hypothetical protein
MQLDISESCGSNMGTCMNLHNYPFLRSPFNFFLQGVPFQEAKYVESWPNTTSAWAGWSRFDIPVNRYGGVHFPAILHQQYTGVSYLPLG